MEFQIRRKVLLSLVMFAYPIGTQAQEQITTAPSLELLEFLGEFETDSGEWINPIELLGEEFSELLEMLEEDQSRASDSEETNEQDPEPDDA